MQNIAGLVYNSMASELSALVNKLYTENCSLSSTIESCYYRELNSRERALVMLFDDSYNALLGQPNLLKSVRMSRVTTIGDHGRIMIQSLVALRKYGISHFINMELRQFNYSKVKLKYECSKLIGTSTFMSTDFMMLSFIVHNIRSFYAGASEYARQCVLHYKRGTCDQLGPLDMRLTSKVIQQRPDFDLNSYIDHLKMHMLNSRVHAIFNHVLNSRLELEYGCKFASLVSFLRTVSCPVNRETFAPETEVFIARGTLCLVNDVEGWIRSYAIGPAGMKPLNVIKKMTDAIDQTVNVQPSTTEQILSTKVVDKKELCVSQCNVDQPLAGSSGVIARRTSSPEVGNKKELDNNKRCISQCDVGQHLPGSSGVIRKASSSFTRLLNESEFDKHCIGHPNIVQRQQVSSNVSENSSTPMHKSKKSRYN
ncbi:hypothetical protein K6025_05100 [Ehrlichia sp. JZT12]